jgi:biotin carboxyl carrier protein
MKITLAINDREHAFEWEPGPLYSCRLDGAAFEADVREIAPGLMSILIAGQQFYTRIAPSTDAAAPGGGSLYSAQVDGARYVITVQDPRRWSRMRGGLTRQGRQQITAPMPGKVVRVLVAEGQRVEAGQGVVVVEAMKMQNEIKSPKDGTVVKVLAEPGQTINGGEVLAVVE